jgi:hypothetical protein
MPRRKKGPTDAMKWLEKIERAKKVRAEWAKNFRIALAYEYYEGRQRPDWVPDSEWITLNMIYSSLEAILPSMYAQDPYFYIKLKTSYKADAAAIPEMEVKANVRQAMLNYLKGELRLKQKGRLSVKDAFFQYGVCKIHYTADLSENPKAGEVVLGEDGRPQLDQNGQPITEVDLLPANEAYKVSRIHPSDFLVDEDAGPDNDDVSWKAQRIKMALSDAKEDLRFPASIRKNLKATEIKDEAEKDREARKKGTVSVANEKKDPDTIVLWEVYDLRNEEWLIVAEGNREFLIAPEEIGEEIDGDPFVDLRFTLRDDSWYPIPPVSQWLDSQREYCEVRSKILAHRKRFNRKYEMYAGAFDDVEAEAAKLTSGEDGTTLIKSQPMQAVFPIPDGPLDMQVHTELAYLKNDFGDLAVGANQRGSSQGIDSATEAGILEKRAVIREGDRVALVQDFVIDIGRKLDQCVQAHITRDQAVKVSGPQGETWVEIRKTDYDEIEGEYEYTVNVGATTPQLPEIERAQLMSFMSTWIQAPQLFAECPTLTKEILESHHIYNEAIIEELKALGEKIAQGMVQQPGATGSAPNTGGTPAAVTGGMAMGMNNVRGGAQ